MDRFKKYTLKKLIQIDDFLRYKFKIESPFLLIISIASAIWIWWWVKKIEMNSM
jgi:hypothetical protein